MRFAQRRRAFLSTCRILCSHRQTFENWNPAPRNGPKIAEKDRQSLKWRFQIALKTHCSQESLLRSLQTAIKSTRQFHLPRRPLRKHACLNSHFEDNDSIEGGTLRRYSVTLRNPYKFNCRTKLAKFFVLNSALDGLFRISATNF